MKLKFQLGKTISLGEKRFSKEEIISYAKQMDPLPFHLDETAAKASRFGGLVCSGAQPFYFFYVNKWLPKYANTIEAGMGIDQWKLIAPVYVNHKIECRYTLNSSKKTKSNRNIINQWKFEFFDHEKSPKLVQSLLLTILHSNSDSHE